MKYSILPFLTVMFFANNAWAYSCQPYISSSNAVMTSSSITIPRSLPVNSQIGVAKTGVVSTYKCENSTPQITYQTFGVRSNGQYISTVGGKRIYSTNIKGIGYAVRAASVSGCNSIFYYVSGGNNIDGNPNNLAICAINAMFPIQPMTGNVELVFYKTDEITGTGTVSIGSAASFILQSNQNSWTYPETNVILTPFTINTTPCEVNQISISVPFGSVDKKAFNGVGSTANTKSFNIALACNPEAKVSARIDGTVQNADNGIIKLTSSDKTATGVGVQLLFNNNPIKLGTSFLTGTTSTNGLYNIPLEARYYQTNSTITPGEANATATFTLTYQ